MTREEMMQLFEKHDGLRYKFSELSFEKFSDRPDLHGLILLDKICGGSSDIIASSEHDTVYLEFDLDTFLEVATEDIVMQIAASGIMYDQEYDSFIMFV